MTLLDDPARLRTALTPLRRTLLERLQRPASATGLADELGLPRQRVNYHLRVLEDVGLVELVETRQRRGCTERFLRSTATSYLVDPGVMDADVAHGADDAVLSGVADRFAAEHLVAAAAATVRDVVRMQAAADRDDQRLLTFTVETEVRFARPGDVHDFCEAVAAAVAAAAARFGGTDGRAYRVVAGGHPAAHAADPDIDPTVSTTSTASTTSTDRTDSTGTPPGTASTPDEGGAA